MDKSQTVSFARGLAAASIDRLATDVRLLDLRGVVSYTDFFVICTGSNPRQTKAIVDHVLTEMKDQGFDRPRRQETDPDGSWVLLDYIDVVLHVFTPQAREFYRLDSLWGQVPQETIEDDAATSTASDAQQSGRSAKT